ncbi:CDP-archaeol synthase [Candidatus Gugararchaeum adminiculabundum]|nr:CDP-archaeol synthase [Candidatus Gugararchaeum adminiculabundum]
MVSYQAQTELLMLIVFVFPSWIANAVPVIFGGGTPMDFGRKFKDDTRILGDGKTWRGFLAGVLGGAVMGVIAAYVCPSQWNIYANRESYYISGVLMGIGAMIGDSLGSFIKRRMRVDQGRPIVLLDQLTFLYVAIAFSIAAVPFNLDWFAVLFLTVVTYAIHAFFNFLSHQIGLKKVPW